MTVSTMVEPRRLKNAPITEALLDFRLSTPLKDPRALDAFHAAVQAEFPQRREMMAVQLSVGAPGALPVTTPPKLTGLQLWSADQTRAVQARFDGFSYSQLRPYDSWETMIEAGRRVWNVFRKTTVGSPIARYAARYVNRIMFPVGPGFQFETYLRTFPHIAPELPQSLGGLFMRIVLPRPDHKCTVIVTEAFDAPALGGELPFILDIDTFVQVPPPTLSDDEVWTRVEMLRAVKNDVFFSCLTPAALELFQ